MKFNAGVFEVRTWGEPLPKGRKVSLHAHNQSHTTFCESGSLAVRTFGPDGKIVAEEHIIRAHAGPDSFALIRKGTWHELESLEDGSTFFCFFPHMDWDGRVAEEYDGNEAAYV